MSAERDLGPPASLPANERGARTTLNNSKSQTKPERRCVRQTFEVKRAKVVGTVAPIAGWKPLSQSRTPPRRPYLPAISARTFFSSCDRPLSLRRVTKLGYSYRNCQK